TFLPVASLVWVADIMSAVFWRESRFERTAFESVISDIFGTLFWGTENSGFCRGERTMLVRL
ncbi:MAG: hypothetical protein CML24_13110, partial [Rhizobiales bacterium]|nr:hypothetical protein [Hyphomicrobiales bacterium]